MTETVTSRPPGKGPSAGTANPVHHLMRQTGMTLTALCLKHGVGYSAAARVAAGQALSISPAVMRLFTGEGMLEGDAQDWYRRWRQSFVAGEDVTSESEAGHQR